VVDPEFYFSEGYHDYDSSDWITQEDSSLSIFRQSNLEAFVKIDPRSSDFKLTDEHSDLMVRYVPSFSLGARVWGIYWFNQAGVLLTYIFQVIMI
jgi:hypothetical protein